MKRVGEYNLEADLAHLVGRHRLDRGVRTNGQLDERKLADFFAYYSADNPHHVAAVKSLQEEIEALDPSLMKDSAEWVRLYRSQALSPPKGYFTPFLLQQLTGYDHSLFEAFFI